MGSLKYGFHVFKKSVGKDSKGIVGEGEFYILISHLSIFPYSSYMLCARQRMGYWEQCQWNSVQGVGRVEPRSALELKRISSLTLFSLASVC